MANFFKNLVSFITHGRSIKSRNKEKRAYNERVAKAADERKAIEDAEKKKKLLKSQQKLKKIATKKAAAFDRGRTYNKYMNKNQGLRVEEEDEKGYFL